MSFIYTSSQSPIFINTTGVSNRRNQNEGVLGGFFFLNNLTSSKSSDGNLLQSVFVIVHRLSILNSETTALPNVKP